MNIRYFIVHNLNEKNRKSSTQYYAAISPSNSLGTVTSKLLVFNLHLHANQIKHVIRSIYNFHHDSRLLTFQPNSDKRFRHRHQRCSTKAKSKRIRTYFHLSDLRVQITYCMSVWLRASKIVGESLKLIQAQDIEKNMNFFVISINQKITQTASHRFNFNGANVVIIIYYLIDVVRLMAESLLE